MKHWTPGKGARANSATQASLRLVQVPFSLPCIRRGLCFGHTDASSVAGAEEQKLLQSHCALGVIS